MSKSKFKVTGRVDGVQGATLTIDRERELVFVRPLHRRREYILPLQDVAEMVLEKVVKLEIGVNLVAKRKKSSI